MSPELMLIRLDIMPKAKPASSQEAKRVPEPRGCTPIQAMAIPNVGNLHEDLSWISGIILINGSVMHVDQVSESSYPERDIAA